MGGGQVFAQNHRRAIQVGTFHVAFVFTIGN